MTSCDLKIVTVSDSSYAERAEADEKALAEYNKRDYHKFFMLLQSSVHWSDKAEFHLGEVQKFKNLRRRAIRHQRWEHLENLASFITLNRRKYRTFFYLARNAKREAYKIGIFHGFLFQPSRYCIARFSYDHNA